MIRDKYGIPHSYPTKLCAEYCDRVSSDGICMVYSAPEIFFRNGKHCPFIDIEMSAPAKKKKVRVGQQKHR